MENIKEWNVGVLSVENGAQYVATGVFVVALECLSLATGVFVSTNASICQLQLEYLSITIGVFVNYNWRICQ